MRFLILKTGRKVDMGIDMTGEIDSGQTKRIDFFHYKKDAVIWWMIIQRLKYLCLNNRIIMVLIDRFSYVIGILNCCIYNMFWAWFVIVFLYEAVVLVWNEVVIWNPQINNWMQLASILEPPVNINYKDATRICYNSKIHV